MITDDELRTLHRRFAEACARGNPATVQSFLDSGLSVNTRHPKTGEPVLHIAAGAQARHAVRVLAKQPDCDFLARDRRGRLASELAYLSGNDPALARYLGMRERRQAGEQGLVIGWRARDPRMSLAPR